MNGAPVAGDSPAGPTDRDLVAAVRTGDRAAFAAVYDRYAPRLFDFAWATTRNREDAADAVSDTFLRFAERLGQLRDPDRLRPWLYAIARHECLRIIRARKRVAYDGEDRLAEMADRAHDPGRRGGAVRAARTGLGGGGRTRRPRSRRCSTCTCARDSTAPNSARRWG